MGELKKDAGGKGRRLDSWKEIADYLKREVRTVQRWEEERGLPVHRLPGRGRAAIFAHTGELDEWMHPAGAADGQPEAESGPESASSRQMPPPEAGPTPTIPSAAKAIARPVRVAGFLWLVPVLALILGAVYAYRGRRPPPQSSARRPNTGRVMLAVLPFLNLSANPSQDYFADGLTEEMITDLGQLNPQVLGVIARTSAMKYKGTREDVGQIARELGVSYVLEGSVRREGAQARISAQLIKASDQTHVWAQNYAVQVGNILSVQENVAQAIADKIQINLEGATQARVTEPRPANTEAYDDYLKGLYFFNRRNPQDFEQGASFFVRATREDPSYAPAYAGLAQCDGLLALHSGSAQTAAAAKAAATRAIQLDSSSVQALTARAGIRTIFDYDWPGARADFIRALSLNPNYAPAHHWYANLYLDPQGDVDEAIAEMKRAQEIDPLSLIINTDLGYAYYLAGDSDAEMHQYQRVLEIDPNFFAAHAGLADLYARQGRYDEWLSEYLKCVRASPHPEQAEPVEQLYKLGGYRAVRSEEAHMTGAYGPRYGGRRYGSAAIAYMALGDKAHALDMLEQSFQHGEPGFIYLKVDPLWKPLRSEARFQALERKLGLLGP